MQRKKILITGCNGQVGQSFTAFKSVFPQFELVFVHRGQLDISDIASIQSFFFTEWDFAAVINAAAYTNVDLAETEIQKAWKTNVSGPMLLAKKCKELEIPLIHFSSDYVYDNGFNRPLKESDACCPKSIYAITKFEGEQSAIYYNPNTIVLRTSWVYSENGNNFLKTIVRLTKENTEIKVVNDQIGAPTFAHDLASATLTLLDYILNDSHFTHYGIFNFANEGRISWFDFASEIARVSKAKCIVIPVDTAAFPRPAKRPAYSVFDLSKIKLVFNIIPIPWQTSLEICIKKLSPINP